MFNADDWQKEYHHKTRQAKVYKKGDVWRYEYRSDGVVNTGDAYSPEIAMQRIEDHIKAGIYIAKRKDA